MYIDGVPKEKTMTRHRILVRCLAAVTALVLGVAGALAQAADNLKDGVKQVGRDVGQGAKKVGKEVGKGAKSVGKAVGDTAKEGVGAVKEGGRELKRAIVGK